MRRRPSALLAAVALAVPALLWSPGSAAAQTAAPRSIDDGCPAAHIQEDGFPDVAAANPHETAVDCVVHWRVAQGRTDRAYGPAALVDRAQMASFLVRLVEASGGSLPPASRDWFGDDGTTPHQDSINRLAEAGIVGGSRPGAYAPGAAVTRAQMAAFLTRAYDHRAEQSDREPLAEGADAFTDDEQSVLEPEINTAAGAGIAGGYGGGTYRPGGLVPRDQMATFLARTLDLVVEGGMAAVPAGPRALTSTGFRPYASVGPVTLHTPGDLVEVIGFHEAGHDGAQRQEPAPAGARTLVLPTRNRGNDPQSAADLVVDPSREVRAPVTGRVVRAGSYQLYCRYADHYLVIEPDARPGWEVKVLHFAGLRVTAGQRVDAGITVIGSGPRLFPFRSQIDDHTAAPHWPHVHVEVVDTSIPDRPGGGDC